MKQIVLMLTQKKCMIKLNDAMDSIEAQDCVPKADNAKETEKAKKIFRCSEENCNTLAKAKEALMEDTTGGDGKGDGNGAGQASLAAASIAVGVIMARVAL